MKNPSVRLALMLGFAACRGGDELDQPNPPPVWPLDNIRTDALPHLPTTREQAADAAATDGAEAVPVAAPTEGEIVPAPTDPVTPPAVEPAPLTPPVDPPAAEGTDQ